ncbi:hypothetical protein FOCC_FOCC001382 [Frankliniella occidentalis]|nr:hypothetical protein FOCC_FOCC001382 [Frankliniella occidentalis]
MREVSCAMAPWRAGQLLLLALAVWSVGAVAPPSSSPQLQRLVRPAVQGSLFYQLSAALPAVNASCQCSRQASNIVRAALLGHASYCLAAVALDLGEEAHPAARQISALLHSFTPFNSNFSDASYCLAAVALDLGEEAHPAARQISALLHSFTPFNSNFSDPGHRVPRFSAAYLGVCAPSSCTAGELQAALESLLNEQAGASDGLGGASFRASVSSEMCRSQDHQEPPDGTGARIARLALWWTVAAVLFATFLDIVCLDGEGPPSLLQLVRCLSARQNWRRLIDTRQEEGAVAVLHGVRGINALGLLVAHKSVALLYQPYVNRTAAVAVLGQPWSIIGRVAILYTDCFILLSGVLAARALLRRLDRTKAVPIVRRLVDRYVRLTPLLLALVALCTLVLPGLGRGPMWGLVVEPHAALCRQHWWRNVLYIHNYYGFEDMCLTHTHQLGIDMQLFAVAPLLVYPLWRWPRAGAAMLALLAAWSTALRHRVVLDNKLATIVYFGMPVSQMFKTASMSYILPTHRLTVYIMGLGLGYALHRVPESYQFSRAWAAVGWLVAAPLGLLPVFGPWEAATPGYQYDAHEAAQYAAFAPILWGGFVCWGVLACARGAGVLSWRGWVVFTRVAFALYLAQFPVFFYNVGSTRHAQYYTLGSLLNIAEFAFIIAVSVVLCLTFEMPFQELWKTYTETKTNAKERRPGTAQKFAARTNKSFPTASKRKSA